MRSAVNWGHKMKRKLTAKQIEAYRLISGEHKGLSTADAATKMGITPQSINRLLRRAEKRCPELFPLLTKQEADTKALFAIGWTNAEIADKLGVGLSRVSQIVSTINNKQDADYRYTPPIKIVTYNPYLDSQIKRKF